MGWKHYQTVDPPERESQAGSGLFCRRLLTLHIKFQFSKSIKSSTLHFFFILTYPLRAKISLSKNAQKSPKNLHKIDQQWLMK